jgi:MFS family permease
MTAACILLLVARELWVLYLFAVIFGFGYGGVSAVASPLGAEFFGLRSHGAILGVVLFSNTIGGAIGPLITGRIFDLTNSYQTAFLIMVVLSIVGLAVFSLLRPPHRQGLATSL